MRESPFDRAVTVRERDLITDRIPFDFINQSTSPSPRAHHFRHQDIGSRSLTVTALSGVLARIIGEGTQVSFSNGASIPGGPTRLKLE